VRHAASSYFSGFANKDVAFFHPESRTLMQADLLFNFPPTEQVSYPPLNVRVATNGCLVLQIQAFRQTPADRESHPLFLGHKQYAWALGTDKQ